MDAAPVSAVLPTWNRLDILPTTLAQLHECEPPPAEVIVHVDAGDEETAPWLREHWPDVKVLVSKNRHGPGGGRNKLMEEASQPYVASFDDDSYPLDTDYFERLLDAFGRHPKAGLLSSVVVHRGEETPPPIADSHPVINFMGCGCAYRMEAWDQTDGYLPRPVPYGIEEIDVGLQLLDCGWKIMKDKRLRIMHDTDLTHHDDPFKTAGTIVNRALLAYIRYPAPYLWLGVAQYVSRILWCLRAGRTEGIWDGIRQTPAILREYWNRRDPVSPSTLRHARQLMAAASS